MEMKDIKHHVKSLLKKQNVVGVALGHKKGKQVIKVLVSKKIPLEDLSIEHHIPEEIEGLETEVIETGEISAFTSKPDHIGLMRPAVPGISIGHFNVTAGTFGAVVYRNNHQPYILSNNHVLANSNKGIIGDAILQPGKYDKGTMEDKIATLEDFHKITFVTDIPICKTALFIEKVVNWISKTFHYKYTWHLKRDYDITNFVDCAIAKPLNPELIKDEILEIGKVKGTSEAGVGTEVQKSGRTTGLTKGSIEIVNATVNVGYGGTNFAIFEGQMIAGAMSAPGDSGSLVLDMNNKAVGLLFAGSDQVTIINPIDKVLEALNIYIKD